MAKNEKEQPKVKPRIPKDEKVEEWLKQYGNFKFHLNWDFDQLEKEARNKKSYKTELIQKVYKDLIGMLQSIGHIEVLAHEETERNE